MNVWEIWFADFPFEDSPTVVKSRPVIILNIDPLEVLSIKVTSKDVRADDPYDIAIVHWKESGLKFPSVARISKVMLLSKDKFKFKIGTLHDEDRIAILSTYGHFLEESL